MDAVGFDRLFDLRGQFASGGKNQHTWAAGLAQLKRLGKQHVQNGQGKTSGFTRTGLCGSQQVAARKYAGNGLCLDGGGYGVAGIGNRTQKRIGQPEVSEGNRSRQENSSIVMPVRKSMWTPIGADEQGVKTPLRRAPTELGLSEARGLERCAVDALYAKPD